MYFEEHPKFSKDFKNLLKKFLTLENDFALLRKTLQNIHEKQIKHDVSVKIKNCCAAGYDSYKVRKFPCRSLKGRGCNSGLRVIYVHHGSWQRITFIEIYFKAEQQNEDKNRLNQFLVTLK